MENKPDLIAVAHVGAFKFAPSGGALRTGRSLKEYSKHFNVCLVLPPTHAYIDSSLLSSLKNELNLYDIIVLDTRLKPILTRSSLNFIFTLESH